MQRVVGLCGDSGLDYQAATGRYYFHRASAGRKSTQVWSYTTMRPAEDWAEAFAHDLHIRGTIATAAAVPFAPAGATLDY